MEIAGLVFVILFGIFSILELTSCYLKNDKYRKIFKTFCVLSLGISMIFFFPNHPLLYLGLILGSLGDFFLLYKKDIFFSLGVVSFLIGHLLYFSEIFVSLIGSYLPNYFYYIFISSILVLAIILIFPLRLLSKNKLELLGGSIYFSVLIHALVLMILATIYLPSSFMYFGIIGYIFFLISDFILVWCKCKKNIPYHNLVIMSTYLLAEGFIALSFYLTLINL